MCALQGQDPGCAAAAAVDAVAVADHLNCACSMLVVPTSCVLLMADSGHTIFPCFRFACRICAPPRRIHTPPLRSLICTLSPLCPELQELTLPLTGRPAAKSPAASAVCQQAALQRLQAAAAAAASSNSYLTTPGGPSRPGSISSNTVSPWRSSRTYMSDPYTLIAAPRTACLRGCCRALQQPVRRCSSWRCCCRWARTGSTRQTHPSWRS
jgi:hypothetical protein